jgi:hypothetical protein
MALTIKFSDASKTNIIINDGQNTDQSTPLTFVGKRYIGYGDLLQTDLLHILENFASTTSPVNAVEGQFWYDSTQLTDPVDSSTTIGTLKVNVSKTGTAVFKSLQLVDNAQFAINNAIMEALAVS